jgi:hypothetical protein
VYDSCMTVLVVHVKQRYSILLIQTTREVLLEEFMDIRGKG